MKKSFITGLVIWLPLALTLWVMGVIINFLTKPFLGLIQQALENLPFWHGGLLFLSESQVLFIASQFLILLLLFGFTVLVGVLGRWFFLHTVVEIGTHLIQYIPFVNTVYKVSKDIISTLLQTQAEAFRQAVIVPFPHQNIYSLGLITRSSPGTLSSKFSEKYVSVFVPTTPNPTTGFLLMVREKDIIYLDISIEDAIKFVISCGLIHPEENRSIKEVAEEQIKGSDLN